jgi:hypothetical protein
MVVQQPQPRDEQIVEVHHIRRLLARVVLGGETLDLPPLTA